MTTRRPSASTCVKTAPTVGPSSTHMPPAITANTMLSDSAEAGDRVGADVHLVLREDRAAERAHGRPTAP